MCFHVVLLLGLGCFSRTPPKPTQRLCGVGQTTAEWVDAELAARGPQGFLDSLQLRVPTVLCFKHGEERGQLVQVELYRLEMPGKEVRPGMVRYNRELLAQRGEFRESEHPAAWVIEPTAGPEPLRVTFMLRRDYY